MSRIQSLMIAAALLGTIVAPTRAQEHGVKVLDDAWVKAIKAGDVEGLVALYAPDAVMYPPDAQEAKGTAAIREAYTGMLSAITVTDASISATYQTVGDVSYGYGTATLSATPKAGGSPQTMEVRVTAVARRTNGKWLYAVDHASVPMAPPPAGPAAAPPAR